jgi:AraC-like DNA-binding protein
MLILSIRIGKSVLKEFSKGFDIVYIYLGLCLLLTVGPLFYLYCRTSIDKEKSLRIKDLLHFVPALVFFLLTYPFYVYGFKNLSEAFAAMLFFIFYAHYMCYLLVARKRYITKTASRASDKNLVEWLTILFYGLTSIWIVYVLNLFEDRIPYVVGPIIYSLTVYTITYLAFVKKYMQTANTVKYQNTNFGEEDITSHFEAIENLIKGEKLFLEPEVSLAMLSKNLKISSQKISYAVNTRAGCNFNEYINRQRVEYAANLLSTKEGNALTIAAIGTEAGFNSLSSFNQAFKKVTGKTPSQFRTGIVHA